MLLKDGGLIFRVNEFFEKKFRSFKDIDVIVRDIIRNVGEKKLVGEMDNIVEVKFIVFFYYFLYFYWF